jgi:hypothetical protein
MKPGCDGIDFLRKFKQPVWTLRTFLGRQQCGGYISLTTKFIPEEGGSSVPEALVYNYHNTRLNNPEKTSIS